MPDAMPLFADAPKRATFQVTQPVLAMSHQSEKALATDRAEKK
jgi:hypothetical protein